MVPILNHGLNRFLQLPPLSVPAVNDKISPHRPASKDPFDDPEVLNQFTQEVEKFDKFIESLTAKTLNGPTPLDMKWKELCDFQVKISTLVFSLSLLRSSLTHFD